MFRREGMKDHRRANGASSNSFFVPFRFIIHPVVSPSPSAPEIDPDAARDEWHDVQAHDRHLAWQCEQQQLAAHRCPPDMPPCPACQQREDEEDFREYEESAPAIVNRSIAGPLTRPAAPPRVPC